MPQLCNPHAHTATVTHAFLPDVTIIATVNHCFMPEITHNATVTCVLITGGTPCAMKAHIFLPDRTHNSIPSSLTVFYGKSRVLQHFIATGVPSFIPDDTIISP